MSVRSEYAPGDAERDRVKMSRSYRRTRAAIAIVAFDAMFVAAWLLNGYFTAVFVDTLTPLNRPAGWLVHMVITLIELSLSVVRIWMRGDPILETAYRVLIVVVLIVSVVDVGSSTMSFIAIGTSWGIVLPDLFGRIGATVLSEVIAVLPETMIVALTISLIRILKEARYERLAGSRA